MRASGEPATVSTHDGGLRGARGTGGRERQRERGGGAADAAGRWGGTRTSARGGGGGGGVGGGGGGGCGRARGGTAVRAMLLAWLLVAGAAATSVRRDGPAAPPAAHRSPRAHDACPGESIAFKVNASDRIFEGRVKSKSPIDNSGMYNVTFGVHKVHKGEESDLKNQHQGVRLQFLDKAAAPGGVGGGGGVVGCQGVGNVVRANIRNNPRYLVFVDRVAPHVFRPRAEPLVKTKQTMQQVRKAMACGGLRLKLKNSVVEVRLRQRLRLHCVVKPGKVERPDLTISWFKNGTRLERGDRIRVKKGRLDIVLARLDDAGEYVCRAERPRPERPKAEKPKAETIRCAEAKAIVRVTPDPEYPTHPPYAVGAASKCIESYCLNGGSCLFYHAIQEMSCECAEGYKGQRCELKDVSNSGSMYKTYICKLGFFTSYYC